MGAWGTSIFSSDDACDVRNEYNVIIGNGIDDETALAALKKFFEIKELCEEDADFWYALAALQHKYGRLMPEVKENALLCIERGFTAGEEFWFSPKDAEKRRAILRKLRNDITGEQPPFKTPKIKREKALGKQGDVLAYHLINYSLDAEAKFEKKLSEIHGWVFNPPKVLPWYIGKYVLLYISRIILEPMSKAIPELPQNEFTQCMMYDWMGNELPDVSVTKGLSLTDYSIIPQKNGGVSREYEMFYTPRSKAHIRKEKYLTNIGQAVGTIPLPFKNTQAVFEMEEELHTLFAFNKDIELKYKEMVGYSE